jgi:hypothetical protein
MYATQESTCWPCPCLPSKQFKFNLQLNFNFNSDSNIPIQHRHAQKRPSLHGNPHPAHRRPPPAHLLRGSSYSRSSIEVMRFLLPRLCIVDFRCHLCPLQTPCTQYEGTACLWYAFGSHAVPMTNQEHNVSAEGFKVSPKLPNTQQASCISIDILIQPLVAYCSPARPRPWKLSNIFSSPPGRPNHQIAANARYACFFRAAEAGQLL